MKLTPLQRRILAAIDEAAGRVISVSRAIHEHPELGKEERFASGLLADTLESSGFRVARGFSGMPTAFLARKGSESGPRVAFLAEYDALPDIGHGCGHNIICSASLAAGIGLGEVVADTGGEVWVVGTPAEETDGAKVAMTAGGAFESLDAALMIHPYDSNYFVTESLAMDAIEIEFFGTPSHAAASPWEGRNALDALILTFNNINALRQQMRPDARVHGIITRGGAAPNVIPEHTAARFYVRARRRDYLDALVGSFEACVRAAALATGTRVEIRNYEASFDDMVNNLTMAGRMRDYFVQTLGAKEFGRAPDSFGSIDMGNVSHVVPAVHVLVDISNGAKLVLHTPEFRVAAATPYAEESLIRAGKALALTGCDILSDPGFLEAVRLEFTGHSESCLP
ncbi:MAG: M20 family metallopeptidase [Spirochaetes bacterium]|nr:M20 family metallopeptidase [Spirochaetota bacterium]